jgi:iron complex transport system permease protein
MSASAHNEPAGVEQQQVHRRLRPPIVIVTGLLLTIGIGLLSIVTGAADISAATVWEAIVAYDPVAVQHYTVIQIRLPRAAAAFIVGASFAVSGAIMQGITRNPLASPGLMGVSAGAGLGVVAAFAFWPALNYHQVILMSMIGSALGTLTVYAIGSLASIGEGSARSHIRFALAGSAIGGLFGALSQGIEVYFGLITNVMYWYAAGVAGVKWLETQIMLPWFAAGIVLALAISRSITLLGLGDEVAAGLGQKVLWVKGLSSLCIFLLVGAAVAVAGPVGFIGLIIPHITRYLIGIDYRWVIPCSAVLGGLLLLTADMLSRLVHPPFETPVGILTSLLGVPFFIYLARRAKGLSL